MSTVKNFADDAQIVGVDVHKHFELVVQVLSYNQIAYLEIALNSVLNQVWDRNWRILIHDDASTDGSQNVIKKFAVEYPDRVIAVLQKTNKFKDGFDVSKSLQGLVTSDFVSRLDADDYFLSTDKLRRQVSYLRNNPNISLTYHSYHVSDERRKMYFAVESNRSDKYSWFKILMGNYIATSTATYRSENSKCLPFELGGYGIQDWPLWVYLETQGGIHFLADIYSVYRVHGTNSFAEKSNRMFEKDMIALHKLCAEMQTSTKKLAWLLTLNLYRLTCILDRPTFGLSHKLLNIIRAQSLGFRRIPIRDPLISH